MQETRKVEEVRFKRRNSNIISNAKVLTNTRNINFLGDKFDLYTSQKLLVIAEFFNKNLLDLNEVNHTTKQIVFNSQY